ncbi:MAG: uroporphyrinogen decarboxylase family protein, partial [bacterium]
ILNAVKDKGVCNVVHVHGINLRFADVADYPAHAFNWSHIRSEPSLAAAREMTDACLIGGVSELRTDTFHPDVLEEQIRAAFAEAGEQKFMVGPGCAIPTDTAPEQIDLIRKTVAGLK